ncbi:MAG TPA: WHG domain-containing protein [Baekduia sp.]|uniref:TetR/AcrR family transcriptional regulator n=1 Tax=Baekduia sp. TaxID=2600305 RepID=UPI002D779E14|nr:WHG domain-containing protein [Baekduia sp.]HET6506400.1 WHG domain-containing protein [Baekduia sp.]
MPRAGLGQAMVVGAAADLADSEGLDAVTLSRVAAALGVKSPSLYNHVEGRDGLIRGIALLGLAELGASLRDAAVGRSGDDALLAATQAYREYVKKHPGRYAAGAVSAPAADDAERQEAAAAVVATFVSVLRAWELTDDDTIHAVRGIRSAVHGFASLETSGGFGLQQDVDESFGRLIGALAAGLRPG